jgi:hypothetical protein
MFEIHARLDVNLDPDDILSKFGLEDHGRVQKTIDNAVIRYMEPYWAANKGILKQNAYQHTDIGSGLVTYGGPYAHYMYYGVLYTTEDGRVFANKGEKKPVNTGIPLKYKKDVNPEAGKFPFERMKADHLEDILEEARKVARDK